MYEAKRNPFCVTELMDDALARHQTMKATPFMLVDYRGSYDVHGEDKRHHITTNTTKMTTNVTDTKYQLGTSDSM